MLTYSVGATVCAKLGCHCDGATEEEEGVEDVKGKGDWCSRHDSGDGACYEEGEG